VGDGDDRQWLQTVARSEGVASRVEFTGYLSDEQLPAAYHEADLFVLASGDPHLDRFSVEGYGIVFAEASASGIASVGYRSGGSADAIVDGVTGVLTEPDEEAFGVAVRELLRSPERRVAMGRAARHHAVKTLSWDAAVTTLQKLLTRLEEGKRRTSHRLETL
jgi:phosphatidylinositol alpha-1,6-mannosyltransferase